MANRVPLLAAGLLLFGTVVTTSSVSASHGTLPDERGAQANGAAERLSMSYDGRLVAFDSLSTNLVGDDTNDMADIFVHDRVDLTTVRVSRDARGEDADNISMFPAISGDGRYVVFESFATDLVAQDNNNRVQVYRHDLETSNTELISLSLTGEASNNDSTLAAVSADGRFVTFYSSAHDLVFGDTNNADDIFLRDTVLGGTERISLASDAGQANGPSFSSDVSDDGRFVVFDSSASNLVPGDNNGVFDVFIRDRQSQTTELVSVSLDGVPAGGDRPVISGDGRYVAFRSGSSNLAAGDTNEQDDVFVRDLAMGTTDRVSVASDGTQADGPSGLLPSISPDGRFVAFASEAENLVAGDTNDAVDVFLRDRQDGTTTRVSEGQDGQQEIEGLHGWPSVAVSADGDVVAFTSAAVNLVPCDLNDASDAFVWVRDSALEMVSVAGLGPRVWGSDRYTTAVAVSQRAFPCGAEVVYIATGQDFPDALAAAPAAAATGGPVLLTDPSTLPRQVGYELRRLSPAEIYIVGGDAAVSFSVLFSLQSYAPTVLRLDGADRYGTAAAVSFHARPEGADTVFVATGTDFPDALVAGVAAAVRDSPVLLVTPTSIPTPTAAELARLRPEEIVIVGGPAVVSLEVESGLSTYSPQVRRLAGPDRYATAAAVMLDTFTLPDEAFVATGVGFPDALAASASAAHLDAALLLVGGSNVPASALAALAALGQPDVTVVGGPAAVSVSVEELLAP